MRIERHSPSARLESLKYHKNVFKGVGKVVGAVAGVAGAATGNPLLSLAGGALGALGNTRSGGPQAPGVIPPTDFYNNLYGVSVRQVKTSSGYKMVADVTYSAEDKAKLAELQGIYDDALADVQSLSALNSAMDIPEFQPVLNAVRENDRLSREDAYKQRSRLEEETLARRGLEDSTSGTEVRQQRGLDLTKQAAADERNLTIQAENMRTDAINRSSALLTFANGSIEKDKTDRSNAINTLMTGQSNMFAQSNTAAANNFGLQNTAYSNQVKADQANNALWTGVAGQAGVVLRDMWKK